MTQFTVGHEELLVPEASSQEFKASKDHYTLIEAKVVSFETKCSWPHNRLYQVSSFLDKMNLHESSMTLVIRMAELEGLLE